MLQYSCDLCGKDLTDGAEGRFVIKMEAFSCHSSSTITEGDLAPDHLEEISQILNEEDIDEVNLVPAYSKMRYDLCASCHKKFLANPLGREAQKFDFSEN